MIGQVLEVRRRHAAREDFVAVHAHILGMVQMRQGRYGEAETVMRESITGWAAVRGDEHPRIGRMLMNLAHAKRGQGASAEALELYQRSDALFEKAVGEDDRNWVDTRLRWADLLLKQGDAERAQDLFRRARESTQRNLENQARNARDQRRLAEAVYGLGRVSAARGETAEAEQYWQESLGILESLDGPGIPVQILAIRARVLLSLDRAAEARSSIETLAEKGWHDSALLDALRDAGSTPE